MADTNSNFPSDFFLVINNQVLPIRKAVVSIGRALDNDIVIHDLYLSREHAKIVFEKGNFIIHDNQSSGGTYVNNQRINSCDLVSGDLIMLGETPIMFVHDQRRLVNRSKKQTTNLHPDTVPYFRINR